MVLTGRPWLRRRLGGIHGNAEIDLTRLDSTCTSAIRIVVEAIQILLRGQIGSKQARLLLRFIVVCVAVVVTVG